LNAEKMQRLLIKNTPIYSITVFIRTMFDFAQTSCACADRHATYVPRPCCAGGASSLRRVFHFWNSNEVRLFNFRAREETTSRARLKSGNAKFV
jgi:hypothetical protein